VPFFDTAPVDGELNGLTALSTWGSAAMLAVDWLIAAESPVRVPVFAWKTIWPA